MELFKRVLVSIAVLTLVSCGGSGGDETVSRDPLLEGFWVGEGTTLPDSAYLLFENQSSFDSLTTLFVLDAVSNCFSSQGKHELVNVGGNRYRDGIGDLARITVQGNILTIQLLSENGAPFIRFQRTIGISPQDLPICAMQATSHGLGFGSLEQLGVRQQE